MTTQMTTQGSVTTPFTTSEGLRTLLGRLDSSEADWRHGPEAEDLMTYTMEKYGALARKHGMEPAEAATAAFEVMRTRAARDAADPWAVVTRAVQLTLMYEARAAGLLCSTARARRGEYTRFHDAERFGDRETPLHEYHPALHVDPDLDLDDSPAHQHTEGDAEEPTTAFDALDRTVDLFVQLGWPKETARTGIEYICNRLQRTGSRLNAFEYLRRDRHAQALLDLDQRCWLSMLRAVLGNQHRDRARTNAGRGVLLLLLIGYEVEDVATMPDIARVIASGASAMAAGGRHG